VNPIMAVNQEWDIQYMLSTNRQGTQEKADLREQHGQWGDGDGKTRLVSPTVHSSPGVSETPSNTQKTKTQSEYIYYLTSFFV
jgi:hypothetical protein